MKKEVLEEMTNEALKKFWLKMQGYEFSRQTKIRMTALYNKIYSRNDKKYLELHRFELIDLVSKELLKRVTSII